MCSTGEIFYLFHSPSVSISTWYLGEEDDLMKAFFFCVMVMVVVEIEMSFGDTHLNARQQKKKKKKNNQMTTTTTTTMMMKNYYSEYLRYRYLK